MKEFLPWSTATYWNSLERYKTGKFSILDIQLSGQCNYNCVYCDSPYRKTPSQINFAHLESLITSEAKNFKWIFVCGVGEPLFGENKKQLLRFLILCETLGIKCTIFTNGSNIDEEIFGYIKRGVLYPLIKIDTFSKELSNDIYGTDNAQKTLDAIEKLFDFAKNENGTYSSIAASIVPTAKNKNEITTIVKKCLKHNVFPLIGQLEYAGNAICHFDRLLLTKNELENIKTEVNSIIGSEYKIPICPAVIADIHITNNGHVSVDEISGLSCSWFWLKTPKTKDICNTNTLTSFAEAEKKIVEYRKNVFESLSNIFSQIEVQPFGGCGGNKKDLLKDYLTLFSEEKL